MFFVRDGESILAKVNTFSKLRTSLAKNLSNLAFLKRCRNNNIVPKLYKMGDPIAVPEVCSELIVVREVCGCKAVLN